MPQNNPKISVIMPSLNVGNYIEQCIKSVLDQTLTDFEIICIDAGSTDGTVEILQKYAKEDSRIQIINTDKKSYGYQVNLGISKARGDYIAIVETDDYIDPKMFETLYNLNENNTVDIIKGNFYHQYDYLDNTFTLNIDQAKDRLENNSSFTLDDEPLFIEGHPSIWSGIYRRKFLEENNIKLLEEPAGGWVDNPFFYETAMLARKIRYIPDAFYYYRESNPNSSSNTFSSFTLPMNRVLDIFDVFNKHDYKNKDVEKLFYNRLFRYIEIILENNNMDIKNLDMPTRRSINKVLKQVDENKVKKLKLNFQKLYYKYSSPLFIIE